MLTEDDEIKNEFEWIIWKIYNERDKPWKS